MSSGEEFEKLIAIMARLRAPDGCPWDREQTMSSLRPFILEEAYELVDAVTRGQPESIREELGDLLLEVVFVTQIAREHGLFSMEDVARDIREKLERRHPHVFGGKRAEGAGQALERWEEIKAKEKPKTDSLLDGVPRSLPALMRAAKLSSRAARAGFDWESREEVRKKLEEELGELDRASLRGDEEAFREELGDVLFALVNLARHASSDAEVALAQANEKFEARFRYLERELRSRGRSVEDATMEELEELWRKAKRNK